ncbi:MAG: hypothetical protein AAGC46_13605 [Solirubrobacteraceae bacterium]|nr:hypothetical protein [Patulibacter sp.]
MKLRALTHPRATWHEVSFNSRRRRADRLLRAGRYRQAEKTFALLHAQRPSDTWIASGLSQARFQPILDEAEAHWAEGRPEVSIALMERAAMTLPHEPEIPLWLAPAAVEHRRFDDAAMHAATAVSLCQDDPHVYFRAAHSARWSDIEAARDYIEAAKDLLAHAAPDAEPFALLDDMPRLEALILWTEGRQLEATFYMEHAHARQPEDECTAGDLAQMLLEIGEHDAARGVLKNALVACPGDRRLLELEQRTREEA